MVVEYCAGALLACLTTLGGIGITYFFAPLEWKKSRNIPLVIGIFFLAETFLYTGLSFTYTLFPAVVLALSLVKATAGIYMIGRRRIRAIIAQGGWLPLLWLIVLLINASVPTSNFDCFSAHFPIPQLFVEHHGYPIRPDFQYLDALPLSAHLWFIPAFSFNLEGYANMVFPIFSVLLFWSLGVRFPGKTGLLTQLLLLSMPEFIRISMDPMVDTATFFLVLVSSIFLFSKRSMSWPAISLLALSFSIKPTLLPLAPIAFFFLVGKINNKSQLRWALSWSLISLAIASIWPIKNWALNGSPWFPYFGSSPTPNIPAEISSSSFDWAHSISDYVIVIFADHRYFLSLGWIPLFFIPLFFLIRGRRARTLLIMTAAGFLLTFMLTPFKNRYFLPFLLPMLPYAGILFSRYTSLTRILWVSIAFNALLFLPYLLQPFHSVIKSHDVHTFYIRKFESYSGHQRANELPPGKILLVGQASHWIKRPHQIAIPSETFLDFSRLEKLSELEDHLKIHNIRHIVIHSSDLKGLAEHSDSWYSKKAYLAGKALDWIGLLKTDSGMVITAGEHHGVEWIQLNTESPPQT